MPALVGRVEEGLLEEAHVVGDDVVFDDTLSLTIVGAAGGFGDVEDEQAGGVVVAGGELAQVAASFGIESSAIGNGETVVEHALVNDVVEEIEGVTVDVLIGDVITDKCTAKVG